MKRIIIFIILLPIIIIAQIDSLEYLNYYPLHIGDKWIYEVYAWSSEHDTNYVFIEEIIGDTLLSNNKRYFIKNDGYFYRIDTTYKVYKYSPEYNSEWSIFDLSPFYNEYDTTYTGESTLIIRNHVIGNAGNISGSFEKIIYLEIEGSFCNCFEFTKGIGISNHNYYEIYGWDQNLKGAVINGIEYGNLNKIYQSNNPPHRFRLHPNFPNPFNADTKIKYEILKPGNVTIQIFDITGNIIEIIRDSRQETGQYTINWNASNYSTGIYIIQLQVEEFTQSIKCLLLK